MDAQPRTVGFSITPPGARPITSQLRKFYLRYSSYRIYINENRGYMRIFNVVEALSHGNRRDLGGHTMREELLESPSTHKRLAHPSTHSTVLILYRRGSRFWSR